MINIVMSTEFPNLVDEVKKYGFNVIPSEKIVTLHNFESRHGDMQCLKINDTRFVLKECKRLQRELSHYCDNIIVTEKSIEKLYPNNVLLNAVFINNKLFCNTKVIDKSVEKYCKENGIELINVKQGYTKCSTAIIDDLFITADAGIFNSMTANGVEGLLVKSGDIRLNGVEYGFIGGCCFSYGDTVYFTGDITKHPSGDLVCDFLHKHNKNIICLSDETLYDIGGFVIL